jgi:hypothetical protein
LAFQKERYVFRAFGTANMNAFLYSLLRCPIQNPSNRDFFVTVLARIFGEKCKKGNGYRPGFPQAK